ncbi:3-ketoacyl-ACP reductase [Treponema sp.]
MKSIQNQLALVTGGASGIGRLVALGLAEKGARVAIWDLNEAALRSLEAEARSRGLVIKGYLCDVSNRAQVYERATELTADMGPLDILINNAGVVSGSKFLETSDEKIEKTMQVNTLSLFWTAKAFLPAMIERDQGHLVTISSAAGIVGVTGLADYSASKFAAFGFDEAIRMELRRIKSAVRTTVVCPFFIDTGMFEGVQTRFPLLLPIMKQEKAAKRIIKALLKNNRRLIMPPFVYSVYLLRLLPVPLFDFASDFFGVNRTMDHFRGRK